jgi:hypothetical protein
MSSGADLSIPMTAQPAAPLATRAIALRVARLYLAPRWKGLTLAILCAGAFAGISGVLLSILQPAVDAVTHRADPRTLLRLPLTIVALALARGAAAAAQAISKRARSAETASSRFEEPQAGRRHVGPTYPRHLSASTTTAKAADCWRRLG